MWQILNVGSNKGTPFVKCATTLLSCPLMKTAGRNSEKEFGTNWTQVKTIMHAYTSRVVQICHFQGPTANYASPSSVFLKYVSNGFSKLTKGQFSFLKWPCAFGACQRTSLFGSEAHLLVSLPTTKNYCTLCEHSVLLLLLCQLTFLTTLSASTVEWAYPRYSVLWHALEADTCFVQTEKG